MRAIVCPEGTHNSLLSNANASQHPPPPTSYCLSSAGRINLQACCATTRTWATQALLSPAAPTMTQSGVTAPYTMPQPVCKRRVLANQHDDVPRSCARALVQPRSAILHIVLQGLCCCSTQYSAGGSNNTPSHCRPKQAHPVVAQNKTSLLLVIIYRFKQQRRCGAAAMQPVVPPMCMHCRAGCRLPNPTPGCHISGVSNVKGQEIQTIALVSYGLAAQPLSVKATTIKTFCVLHRLAPCHCNPTAAALPEVHQGTNII